MSTAKMHTDSKAFWQLVFTKSLPKTRKTQN